MVRVNSNGSGSYYLRDNGSIIGKFGNSKPTVYRPQLFAQPAQDILARLGDDSVDLVITDPPYGIEFEQNRYRGAELGTLGTLENDSSTEFLAEVIPELDRVLKPTGHFYMFTRWDAYLHMAPYVGDVFGEISNVIVWDKDDGGHGMGDLSNWAPRHEWIIYYQGAEAELRGKRPANVIRQQDVRFTEEPKLHATQKPRALMERLIEVSSDIGDVVLDPFGGSYAVPRAAMRLFRRSVACEIDAGNHGAGEGLVNKELQDDPEYGVDWREVSNLEVRQTEVA